MTALIHGRNAARIDGDFCVFLIGARINRFRDFRGWMPVMRAMPRMLKELDEHPELGLLHSYGTYKSLREAVLVQYWRSIDHLHDYARQRDAEHLPAWASYNRALKDNDSVGIWHETFHVRAGEYEAVYGNMPEFGLARAGELVPATGRMHSMRGRMGKTDGMDHPEVNLEPRPEPETADA